MKAKTKGNVKTAQKAEPKCWWLPQLDTPLGRVELHFHVDGLIRVCRAGGRDLKSPRRLTQHYDDVGLIRDAKTGHIRLDKDYRSVHDRRSAETLLQAVTAWAADNDDLVRRCDADLRSGMRTTGALWALRDDADKFSEQIKAGLFDFNDAGHARTIAEKMVERLSQISHELRVIDNELRQAIRPPTEDKAAA